METSLSLVAGALFGLAAILIYLGIRRLADKTLDPATRRRAFGR